MVPLSDSIKLSLTVDIKYKFICVLMQILQSKVYSALRIIVTIKWGFCCNIAVLFYGTALKFLTALIFNRD